jgi:hypothetical protein
MRASRVQPHRQSKRISKLPGLTSRPSTKPSLPNFSVSKLIREPGVGKMSNTSKMVLSNSNCLNVSSGPNKLN